MASNLQALFDSFDESLLLLDNDAVLRVANQAACDMFPVILGKRFAVEEIQIQVSAARNNYVRLPLEFEIDAPRQRTQRDRLHVKLMASPISPGYLLVVRNVTEAQRFDTIVSNFANLLSIELAQPMMEFASQVNRLLIEAVPSPQARDQLSPEMRLVLDQGLDIAGRVQQLATYSQTFAKSPLLSNERLPIMDLVSALLVRVRPLLERHDIKFHMAGISEELPVIYGSRDWLVEAMFGYIEYTVMHCRSRSDLELHVRPYGNFVNLQIRNRGRGLPKHVEMRSFLPFAQPQAAQDKKPGSKHEDHTLGLGLALCRRIVELHRGHMKIEEVEGEVLSFDLELPSGAPVEWGNQQLDLEQARRYAEDLTRLMQRQRTAQTAAK